MTSKDAITPERIETDSSLRAERAKTDRELAKGASVVERDADQVVARARERADAVLETARETIDAAPPAADRTREGAHDLSEARSAEDEAVTAARTAADEKLEAERDDQKRMRARLLTLEREDTDERLLNERARSDLAVASRDDFLAIVSHDVRGLLAGIAMSAELLLVEPAAGMPPPGTHEIAQRIRRLTARMNRLVGDLLDVVSMESGQLHVEPVEDDAARLLTETMDSFGPLAAARHIRLRSEVVEGRTAARFDHDRILQVLTNLVGNAIKFTKPGGSIALGLTPTADGIQFTVRDTGCGIASDPIDAIFGRFSQAAQTDRRGLGLGLYISRCIVDAHGGTIWAESELGQGSTFHFTLPRILAA
jgi:signal transduction histidine kinase